MKAEIKLTQNKCGMIRKLNGGTFCPPISSENAGCNLRQAFADLHLPITRVHDAALNNPGLSMVDVNMIFPLFHADENDPRNYYFKPTDDYLKNAIDAGTQIYYRLGVCIDHSYELYRNAPPADTQKWIRIVCHIIDHYNNGWADGFHWNIKYWEIWNEPEGISGQNRPLRCNWNGTVEDYYKFYAEVAKTLKNRYPELMIGGPSNCGWGRGAGKEFIRHAYDNGAPVDFYSYHIYANSMNWVERQLKECREFLDQYFPKAEIHIAEWSYAPKDCFPRMRENNGKGAASVLEEKASVDAGAFISYTLTHWQDLPVDMAHYYTVSTGGWGLFDGTTHQPKKSYYGLKAFGDLAFFYPEKLTCEVRKEDMPLKPVNEENELFGFNALAGTDGKGNDAILVSNYFCGESEITFDLGEKAYKHAHLFILDRRHDLEDVLHLENPGRRLTFKNKESSAVLLLKLA